MVAVRRNKKEIVRKVEHEPKARYIFALVRFAHRSHLRSASAVRVQFTRSNSKVDEGDKVQTAIARVVKLCSACLISPLVTCSVAIKCVNDTESANLIVKSNSISKSSPDFSDPRVSPIHKS